MSTVSFDQVYRTGFLLAFRVAFRVTGSMTVAEEIAQETLARAYGRWDQVAGHSEAWIATVAVRLAIDAVRAQARHPRGEVRELGRDGPDVARRLDLVASLTRLPKRQREAVVCRYLADLSVSATADFLGVTQGAVKQHVTRGLAALRLDLAEHPSEGAVRA